MLSYPAILVIVESVSAFIGLVVAAFVPPLFKGEVRRGMG
jgi:hypothetical protein